MDTAFIGEAFNDAAIKLVSFILILGAAYMVPFIVLKLMRLPSVLANILSIAAFIFAFSYSFPKIFNP